MGERADYFVYALVDPRSGVPFYIGKGRGNRPHQHISEALRFSGSNLRKSITIRDILAAGCEPETRMLSTGLTEAEAFRGERAAIFAQGRGALTNISPGRRSDAEIAADAAYHGLLQLIPPDDFMAREYPATAVAAYWDVAFSLYEIAGRAPEAFGHHLRGAGCQR